MENLNNSTFQIVKLEEDQLSEDRENSITTSIHDESSEGMHAVCFIHKFVIEISCKSIHVLIG